MKLLSQRDRTRELSAFATVPAKRFGQTEHRYPHVPEPF